jgi:hypothetical protein
MKVLRPANVSMSCPARARSSGYKIDASSGRLVPISGSIIVLTQTEGLAIAPSGKYVYAAQFAVNVPPSIYACRIDPARGRLALLPRTPLTTAGDMASTCWGSLSIRRTRHRTLSLVSRLVGRQVS